MRHYPFWVNLVSHCIALNSGTKRDGTPTLIIFCTDRYSLIKEEIMHISTLEKKSKKSRLKINTVVFDK